MCFWMWKGHFRFHSLPCFHYGTVWGLLRPAGRTQARWSADSSLHTDFVPRISVVSSRLAVRWISITRLAGALPEELCLRCTGQNWDSSVTRNFCVKDLKPASLQQKQTLKVQWLSFEVRSMNPTFGRHLWVLNLHKHKTDCKVIIAGMGNSQGTCRTSNRCVFNQNRDSAARVCICAVRQHAVLLLTEKTQVLEKRHKSPSAFKPVMFN